MQINIVSPPVNILLQEYNNKIENIRVQDEYKI